METKNGSPLPLGATKLQDGVNFAIYAKNIENISLCFFEEKNLQTPFYELNLTSDKNKTGDVWHALVNGLPDTFVYAYRITKTNQKNTSHLVLDPYAKMVVSDPQWHTDPSCEAKYNPLAKFVISHSFNWENDAPLHIPMQDLVIYEMHVRGFTCDSSSQISSPGTYQGVIDKIPYLKELGINAVELMPIHEFNEQEALQTNPETNKKLHNYFGYSTVNFFAPMTRYAKNSETDKALTEFKSMVKELHKNGIEVILDVVFNHTAEGNEKGPVISFKALDDRAYYMMNNDGNHLNFSGCGNTFNCNHPVTREFIIDALRYWVLEMHIDGFRFDLASIFSRAADGTPLDNAPLIEAISYDPILASTKLIAEAWDPAGLYQVGKFGQNFRWSEWNGKYRDVVRSFIKGSQSQKNAFAGVISGSHDLYGGRAPSSSINFITAHDGFSLKDLVSYNEKHNNANGEDNRDGLNNNDSWNCGFEGNTEQKKVINLRRKLMRNYHLALMVSQGVPMILMGDEYAHTRNGNNNTWCQDNELNWFLWNQLKEQAEFYRFYKKAIHFRKNNPLLRRNTFFQEKDVRWHGLQPDQPDWDHDNHFVAYSLHNEDGNPALYIAFNSGHTYLNITLPSPGEGKNWQWVVNTNNASPQDFYEENNVQVLKDNVFRIAPYSSIVLKVS